MKLIPTFERVLVQADPEKDKTQSGLLIPDDAKEPSNTGTVVMLGPLAAKALPGISEGDSVMYLKYAGSDLRVEGQSLRMIMANDIIAKIDHAV